jgi:hypothetical protein
MSFGTALKVRLSPEKARVATVALGMGAEDVMQLFRPAPDHAEENRAIVLDSNDGGDRAP